MTQLLAPTGTTKKDFADPTSITTCWIQSSMYPNLAKYAADATKSPYLNTAIIAACAAINKMCNRKFNKQQADEIFPNETLMYRDYKTYSLKNRPIVTVDNCWVNVTNTFAPIDLNYLQLLTEEGIVKILPTFSVYVQTTLPWYAYQTASNLWIRYTSGYAVDYSGGHTTNEVPEPVRLATSMYVDYWFSRFELTGGVKSFSTQTYSQTSAGKGEDPILSAIEEILTPFKIYSIRA